MWKWLPHSYTSGYFTIYRWLPQIYAWLLQDILYRWLVTSGIQRVTSDIQMVTSAYTDGYSKMYKKVPEIYVWLLQDILYKWLSHDQVIYKWLLQNVHKVISDTHDCLV